MEKVIYASFKRLDKNHPVPLYYQLVEAIREAIERGELTPGQQLPSERVLSERYGVSRMTARQALGYLVQDGVLTVKAGVGTFVAQPKLTYDALHLLGFTAEMMQHGGTVTSTVLEQAMVQPPQRVAAELELAPPGLTIKIVRLRQLDEVPLLLETTYIPARLCPGLEDEDLSVSSLYALLEHRYGLTLRWARQTFEATVANDYEQQLFGVKANIGMILLRGVTYTEQNHPVEYFKAVYRGDRFQFVVESQRNFNGGQPTTAPSVSVMLS